MRVVDITDKRFSNLVAIRRLPSKRTQGGGTFKTYWEVRCDCGRVVEAAYSNLRDGRNLSCGDRSCPHAKRFNGTYADKNAGLKQVYGFYRTKAKRKRLSFKVTLEEFSNLISQDCFYCGRPPSNSARNDYKFGAIKYSGVDRVDNKKGYEVANCVPCCALCNTMKHILSHNDFILHLRRILSKHG